MNNKLPPLNPDNSVPPERIQIILKCLMTGDIEYHELSYHDRCCKEITQQSLEKLASEGFQKEVFSSVPTKFHDDEEIITAAYGLDVNNLGLASTRLRQDKDFIFSVVEKYPLQSFNPWTALGLSDNRDFLLDILKLSSSSFAEMPSFIKNDLDVALNVVKRNGRMLKFCPSSLRDNYALVKAATSQCPEAILDASRDCMMKDDIILPLLADHGLLLRDLPDNAINKKMCMVAMKSAPITYKRIEKKYQKDKDVALVAFENGLPIEDLHENFKTDAAFICKFLDENILDIESYLERNVELERMDMAVKELSSILQSRSQDYLSTIVRRADCSDEDASNKNVVPNPPNKRNIKFVEMALTFLNEEHLISLMGRNFALKNTFLNSLINEELHRKSVSKIEKTSIKKQLKKRKVMP